MLRDGFPKGRRAALRHISMEAILYTLVIHTFMQRRDDRGDQRKGNIPDAHPVKMGTRMLCQIGLGLLGNMIEKIGFFQIRVAEVWCQHGINSF